TKVPRFTFEKFPQADKRLTTQMKSVGEVMAIGRTFQESLQKALRGLETGSDGLNEQITDFTAPGAMDKLRHEVRNAGPERLWYLADAFRAGLEFDEVVQLSMIDAWFVAQIEDLVREETRLRADGIKALDEARLRALKRKGF